MRKCPVRFLETCKHSTNYKINAWHGLCRLTHTKIPPKNWNSFILLHTLFVLHPFIKIFTFYFKINELVFLYSFNLTYFSLGEKFFFVKLNPRFINNKYLISPLQILINIYQETKFLQFFRI